MHTFHFENELFLRPSPHSQKKNIIWFHFILLSISIQFMIAFLSLYCACVSIANSVSSRRVSVYGTIQVFRVDANIVLPFSWCCCCFFFFGFYSISQFQIQTYKRISVVLMLVIEFMAKQIENKEFYCCLFPSAIHSPKCNPKTWRRKKTSNTKKRSVSVCTVTILCDTFRVHKHKDVNGEGSEK